MTDRDHRFSEGEGFDDPYEGFDFDPAELRVDLDPSKIDPVDSHALADIVDEATIPSDEVDAETLIEVGVGYAGINRFEEAADALERAARFATDTRTEQEAWVNKGAVHGKLEEWDLAIGAYREAIHLDDESEFAATAHSNLSFALWEDGQDAKALEHAEQALEIDERFAEAWFNRGFFLNERGLAEQALESLENAIRLGYRAATVLDEKARALEALGEYDEAEEVAERADEIRERAEEDLVR